MKSFVLASLLCLLGVSAAAQYAPRTDDHFFRRRVLSRIDLQEKVNRPLIEKEKGTYVASDSRYKYTQGIIEALVQGWREGKYLAYRPDSLHIEMKYPQFVEKINKKNGTVGTTTTGTDAAGGGDEFGGDEFGGDDFGGDEFGGDEFGGDEFGGDAGTATTGTGDVAAVPATQLDLGVLGYAMEIIEDRIFDKGRSDMVYDIKYIRLMYVDPDGKLAMEPMVAFSYRDVLETLDDTQWKNRFNDSENRSMREIFDLRLYNSFIVDVSGRQSNNLQESEQRKQQLIEMEHHLWSY